MEEDTKIIELKGINRSQTKIDVQDGMCEDIINLRFQDGSWRTSGDGKLVFTMGYKDGDTPFVPRVYSHNYIHINSYSHILGVYNDTIYWYANINTDGVFEPLSQPQPLCQIDGNNGITYTQSGHLLAIVSDSGGISYVLFVDNNKYKKLQTSGDASPKSQSIFPFGDIHLNMDCSETRDKIFTIIETPAKMAATGDGSRLSINASDEMLRTTNTWHSDMIRAFGLAKEANVFTRPFLAIVAVELYDGSYAYATPPTLLWQREMLSSREYRAKGIDEDEDYSLQGDDYERDIPIKTDRNDVLAYSPFGKAEADTRLQIEGDGADDQSWAYWNYPIFDTSGSSTDNPAHHISNLTSKSPIVHYAKEYRGKSIYAHLQTNVGTCKNVGRRIRRTPVYMSGAYTRSKSTLGDTTLEGNCEGMQTQVRGADLILDIDSIEILLENKDLFTAVGIFITPEAEIYDMVDTPEHHGTLATSIKLSGSNDVLFVRSYDWDINVSYVPKMRSLDNIKSDLINSPFFLLRRYSIDEFEKFVGGNKVDLNISGILKSEVLTQQKKLDAEAVNMTTVYVPKVCYSYNGRLHIANLKKPIYKGNPVNTFFRNNCAVKTGRRDGEISTYKKVNLALSSYSAPLGEPVTKNIVYDTITTAFNLHQFPKDKYIFSDAPELLSPTILNSIDSFVCITTTISTSNGEYKVQKYIPPYVDVGDKPYYIEDLGALISYPDARATLMEIVISQLLSDENANGTLCCQQYRKTFRLSPHNYLNIAYFISPNLMPIKIEDWEQQRINILDSGWDSDIWKPVIDTSSAGESFPNTLKVSLTDQPTVFPFENTYKIGNSEIIGICSNNMAVGTGQTGVAPLYVFCKDGIYILMVDASGNMAYPNSRVISREVCNNPHSITPIDNGVLFTTDKGLMIIQGEQVTELGQGVKGDVLLYTDTDASKGVFTPLTAPKNTLLYISELDSLFNDKTEFVEFLRNAILSYDHDKEEIIVSCPFH